MKIVPLISASQLGVLGLGPNTPIDEIYFRLRDSAYAAGIFDGEGYVGVYSRSDGRCVGGKAFGISVRIAQKRPEVLRWIQIRWGGTIHLQGSTQIPCLNLPQGCAREFLIDVQPYLIVKKEQVDYILAAPAPLTQTDLERMKELKRL